MSLQHDLDAFKAEFVGKVPAHVQHAMARADEALLQAFADRPRLGIGDALPDLTLPNALAAPVRLKDMLETGPLIISFYRGGWCPYCNLELRAFQSRIDDIKAAGGNLVAISPQTPDASLTTAEKNDLSFEVLSDQESAAASAFGIVFDLSAELQALYTELGHPLPDFNGDPSWRLPVPATYVVRPEGQIILSFVDTDYRRRLEPDDAIAALRSIKATQAA